MHEKTYIGKNNAGQSFKAYKLKGTTWLVVFDETRSVRKAHINNIHAGKVRDLYKPSRYSVGYDGDFIRTPYWTKAKDLWSNMLKRCYFKADKRGYYGRCFVSPRWHCFANFLSDIPSLQNFDKWLENKEPYELDKDSIVQGNDTYSRETCIFLDRHTNRSKGKGGKKLVNGQWVTTAD